MRQRRKGRRKTVGESDIIQFIVDKTGLSTDLVNRIVEGGELWPRVVTFQQYFDTRGTPLDTALSDHDDMLEGGFEAMDVNAKALQRHQHYVATSLGVSEDEVRSISDAIHEFLRRQVEDLRQAKRRLRE